jgi:hypothetical protein
MCLGAQMSTFAASSEGAGGTELNSLLEEIDRIVAVERFDGFSDAFMKQVKEELSSTGKCRLKGFMRPEAVTRTVELVCSCAHISQSCGVCVLDSS